MFHHGNIGEIVIVAGRFRVQLALHPWFGWTVDGVGPNGDMRPSETVPKQVATAVRVKASLGRFRGLKPFQRVALDDDILEFSLRNDQMLSGTELQWQATTVATAPHSGRETAAARQRPRACRRSCSTKTIAPSSSRWCATPVASRYSTRQLSSRPRHARGSISARSAMRASKVDEKNTKHRDDGARLLQVLRPDASYPLPETVANDMRHSSRWRPRRSIITV